MDATSISIPTQHLSTQDNFFDYLSVSKANDDPSVVVALYKLDDLGRCNIDVFKLEGRRLSRTARFPCLLNSEPYGFRIMFVTQSQVCLEDIEQVQAYSILNGELLHAFNTPARALHASANGSEMFLGFNAPTL